MIKNIKKDDNKFKDGLLEKKEKHLIVKAYLFISETANMMCIAASIFSIFFLLLQIKLVSEDVFLIKNFSIVINIITIFFMFIFIEQLRLAPRASYFIVAVIQIVSIMLLNIFSKKYYDTGEYHRMIWAVLGSIVFLVVIVSNWMRLSYSKFTLSQLILTSFAFIILLGSLLLYLPLSSKEGSMGFIDSLFMATSAVCVTGLATVDVATNFTFFGQLVLLMLIQIGGLGIMSMSAILLLFLRGKGSVKDRVRTLELFDTQNKDVIRATIKVIFVATFLIEMLGAIVLFTQIQIEHVPMRIWSSIFHSISAFCNAGFSLYSDSLHSYLGNTVFILAISMLIIIGGIGYPVILTMLRFFFERMLRIPAKQANTRFRVDAQSRIVLFTTTLLIVFGALFIFLNEYSSAMNHLSLKEKILVSIFHSVSPRTAGFESISLNTFSAVTLSGMMFLMFVGASPSSTGGGVKTTTLFVFVSSVITAIKNRPYIVVAGRKIPAALVNKSVAIVTLALAMWFGAALAIFYIEKNHSMLSVAFETVSAVATVGLSLGITSSLGFASKCILIILMFVGRVGYLTIFMGVGSVSEGRYAMIDIPTENVTIG